MIKNLILYDKTGKVINSSLDVQGTIGEVMINNLIPETEYTQGEFFISWEVDSKIFPKTPVPGFTTLKNMREKIIVVYFSDLTQEQLENLKGDNAYRIALDNGFNGTQEEWLKSLKGEPGEMGEQGEPGKDGVDITEGGSAYEIALAEGFEGTREEWLESLKGEQGEQGTTGEKGEPGEDGLDGIDGENAYELALANGFIGNIQDYLESLNGEDGINGADGDSAYEVALGNGFEGSEEEWLTSLKGEPGIDGKDGFSDYLDTSTFNIVDDGITDNRLEITRIIQKAKEENKKVFIPKVQGKGYYVSNYINITDGENIHLVSNSATIIGKGFNFNNVSGIDITGFIFKGKNTDTYSDDGIRVYNSSNINITNNMFNSSFIRCRVENQEDSNENINIDNNIFVGDVESQKNSSSSNLIEVYGYKNVTINSNYINAYNYHRFIKLSSIIFTGNNGLQTIRDKGIVDGITITNNVIKGSINNKQVIDGFSGINNLIMHNNLFDVKGAVTIFENKISSGSDSFKVASCRQMSIKDNTVNVYDSTMSNAFYMYSYMGTPLQETETNHYSNVELSGNKLNNYTDKDISLGTIAGFKNVVVTDNVLNSNSNKGIFYAMSIHSSENVIHTNNVYNSGSVFVYPTKDTSDPSVAFNMSSKNILSKGNMYNDIRSYGGEVIRNHKNLNNITISNNNYVGNKGVNDLIISNIYIRDIVATNIIVSGNSSVFDQEQSNITGLVNSTVTNFKEYGNSWNKNDIGGVSKTELDTKINPLITSTETLNKKVHSDVGISLNDFPRLQGETDDRNRMQRAIDKLASLGGGRLLIPNTGVPYELIAPGDTTIQKPYRVKITTNNIHIEGVGMPLIKMKGITKSYIDSVDDISSSGRDIFTVFAFIGSENISVKGISFEGEWDGEGDFRYASPRAKAIGFIGTKNALAENVHGRNILGNTVNAVVSQFAVEGFYKWAINTSIINSSAYMCLENGFNYMGGTTDGKFIGNISQFNGSSGFEGGTDGLIISNNISKGNKASGLSISGKDYIISNNVITDSTNNGELVGRPSTGIRISGGQKGTITSNRITNSEANEIVVYPGVSDINITNNVITQTKNNVSNNIVYLTGTTTKPISNIDFRDNKIISSNTNLTNIITASYLVDSKIIGNSIETISGTKSIYIQGTCRDIYIEYNTLNKGIAISASATGIISKNNVGDSIVKKIELGYEPKSGYWNIGDIIENTSNTIALGSPDRWRCTKSGTATDIKWEPNKEYTVGTIIYQNTYVYKVNVAGTTGSTPPSHYTGVSTNGTLELEFISLKAVFEVTNQVGLYQSITNVPLFKGQFAQEGNKIFISVGTSSNNDWVQISNN